MFIVFRFLKISEGGTKLENLERKKLKLNIEKELNIDQKIWFQKLDSLSDYSLFPYRQ